MGKAWTAADLPQGRTSPTAAPTRPQRPAAGVTIPEPGRSSPDAPKTKLAARRSEAERLRHERDPVLRPLFGTTQTPGYAGTRFVAVGLDDGQVEALRQAAVAAGVREGQ